MESERINAITCTTWVPQGVAKEIPDKVEITKEELARIIKETSKTLVDLEEDGSGSKKKTLGEEDYTALEVEALEEDMKIFSIKNKGKQKDVEMDEKESDDEEWEEISNTEENGEEASARDSDLKNSQDDDSMTGEDIIAKYNFENYDLEKEGIEDALNLANLVVHANNDEDPFLTHQELDEDIESENENHKLLPTDNLITVGHVDGDAASLEVYVYNSKEESLYVHHDILLPFVPLCMEWLNYDPGDENLRPGNMVAIGSMSPSIDVWDLDIVDCLEPAFVLKGKSKLKKKAKSTQSCGHQDAVLCLAWNRQLEHILASGSADQSVILWDLEKSVEAQKLKEFGGRVQDVKWHPERADHLLTASIDKQVKLFDCSSGSQFKSWKLDGEVESLAWNPSSSHSFCFLASTDRGTVYSIDVRKNQYLNKFQAHDKTCTGMVLNPQCPGCLVTVSEDETVKIWDISKEEALLVEESRPNLGIIHTVSCSPDSPFVLSLGGNNKVENFKVWDIRDSRKVRVGFFDRLGLPIDDTGTSEPEARREGNAYTGMKLSSAESKSKAWKPPSKSRKKKGGHLNKRKKF